MSISEGWGEQNRTCLPELCNSGTENNARTGLESGGVGVGRGQFYPLIIFKLFLKLKKKVPSTELMANKL